jgi:hypothetical protein
MIETMTITLTAVQPVAIHGSPYFDIQFTYKGQPQLLRINPEAFYPNPQPGDEVEVSMVMGNILSAKRVSPVTVAAPQPRV